MASTYIINNNTTAINFSLLYSLTNNNYNNYFPAKFPYLKHTSIYNNHNNYIYKSQQQPLIITTIIPLATTNQSSESESLLSDDNDNDDGIIEVEIEKISKNRRRIKSTVRVDASLERVWGILTDYERLAEFIPSLVVSQVLDKQPNFARLLQIGQQNLAFGLKFNAKGVVDCYEKDFESLPNGQRRDIEFKMIEGDFELFEGKWSIEQYTDTTREQRSPLVGQRYYTTLSYMVEVEPKMWLPVQLVEGRISKEIRMNLFCIREVAQKI
uniref:uncharacterized protein LOC122607883 n=1 Tax=Erigeron canadensis TaxID=72917 RepID=UPI001CB8A4CC|nr:uncharacterized protein LOC122607883 [Erigeron canadensis]